MQWSEPLKAWRARVGISQEGTAQRMGLSLRQFQEIEAKDGEVRDLHVYAHDMASMHMALDSRYDTSALTPTAVKLVSALASRLTHGDLVRGGVVYGARAPLSQGEYDALLAYERAAGRSLSEHEVEAWAERLRSPPGFQRQVYPTMRG